MAGKGSRIDFVFWHVQHMCGGLQESYWTCYRVSVGIAGALIGSKWGFPKIRGTFLGGPHNKDCSI